MLIGQNTQRRAGSAFTYLADTLENISKNQQNNSDVDAGVDSDGDSADDDDGDSEEDCEQQRTRMSEINFHASKQSGKKRNKQQQQNKSSDS